MNSLLKTLVCASLFIIIIISCKKEDTEDFDFSSFAFSDQQNFDVILLIGQSNTYCGDGYDPSIDTIDDRVVQLGRYGDDNMKVIPAIEPLSNFAAYDSTQIGFATTFANLYVKNGFLESGRKLLIIPCGLGGTGFINKYWRRGDTLYTDAIKRTKGVLEANSNNRLVCFLWHQGEADAGNKDFPKILDRFIYQIKVDIIGENSSIPFILGGTVPYSSLKFSYRREVQIILSSTPQRVPNTGYADPEKPFVISKPDNEVDLVHFDANGQREMGRRYFNEYCKLIK